MDIVILRLVTLQHKMLKNITLLIYKYYLISLFLLFKDLKCPSKQKTMFLTQGFGSVTFYPAADPDPFHMDLHKNAMKFKMSMHKMYQ